jgi:hypothetical protein
LGGITWGNFVTGLFRYLGCGKTEQNLKGSPMAIPLDPRQIVSFEELLIVLGSATFGDGEGGRQRTEEKE